MKNNYTHLNKDKNIIDNNNFKKYNENILIISNFLN